MREGIEVPVFSERMLDQVNRGEKTKERRRRLFSRDLWRDDPRRILGITEMHPQPKQPSSKVEGYHTTYLQQASKQIDSTLERLPTCTAASSSERLLPGTSSQPHR